MYQTFLSNPSAPMPPVIKFIPAVADSALHCRLASAFPGSDKFGSAQYKTVMIGKETIVLSAWKLSF